MNGSEDYLPNQPMLGCISSTGYFDPFPWIDRSPVTIAQPAREVALRALAIELLLALAEYGPVVTGGAGERVAKASAALQEELAK